MTGFLSWLPDVLRSAGVDTYVLPGAETRSSRSAGLSVLGVVWHHTATSTGWADGHVAALLRDGRRDLAGPLAQVGIERDGTWVIVAMGRANHNGYGAWGNDSIGLEFYNSGVGESWPSAQVESGVIGTAAICRHLRLRPATQVRAHRETDPRRKIDPAGLDMSDIRRRVCARLQTPTTPQEPDMPELEIIEAFHDWLGRPPSDAELADHTAYAAFHGIVAAVLNIARSAEAKARR